MATKDSEFSVLIAQVADGKQDAAAGAFSKAFGLDPGVAQQIVKSAPIIFLTGASKAEVKALIPRLTEVSKAGLEFRITARTAQRVPKVNWPVRPQFAFGAGPADKGGAATFNLENNAFVCPSCGETFLFKKLGRLALGAQSAEAPAPAAETPARAAAPVPAPPAPKPAAPVAKTAPPPPKAAPKPAPKPSPKAAPPPPPPPPEDDSLDLLDETPSAPVEESSAPEPVSETATLQAPADDDLLLDEPPSLPDAGSEPPPLPDVPEGESLELADETDIPPPPPGDEGLEITEGLSEDEPTLAEAPGGESAGEEAPPPPPLEDEEAPPPPPEEEAPPAPAPASPTGEMFNVFLSKISSTDKKEQAAKLISEIRECSIEEARDLAGRLIIPLLKDVPKSEAEVALNKFKAIRVTGRMTLSKKK